MSKRYPFGSGSFPVRPITLLAAVLCASRLTVAADFEYPRSEARLSLLRDFSAQAVARAGDAVQPEALVRDVVTDFRRRDMTCPINQPSAPLRTEDACRAAAEKTAAAKLAEAFPGVDLEKIRAEAEEKYPIYQKGDILEIRYLSNPIRAATAKGPYMDRTGTHVKIGRFVIPLEDIARLKENEGEALKFDPEASMKLRQDYVEEREAAYRQERRRFREAAEEEAFGDEMAKAIEANELAGYIRVDGKWGTVPETALRVLQDECREVLARREEARLERIAAKAAHVESIEAVAVVMSETSPGPVAADVVAAATAEPVGATGEGPATPGDETGVPGTGGDEVTGGTTDPSEPPTGSAAVSRPPPVSTGGDTAGSSGMVVYVIIGLGLLVVVAGAVYFLKSVRGGPTPAARKFFEAKGEEQKRFWDKADKDKENFKYVAYRFPGIDEAQLALRKLSFIAEATGGKLRAARGIEFGLYPHQDRFVAYVGGTSLHYALWREASAIFPELPGAEYFRVSTAPSVKLEIPDIEALLHDENLSVEHVGNREGVGTDYSQYYVYKAPDKENALEFLKRATISESGVHVVVETPEGTWGKDENGIYQE